MKIAVWKTGHGIADTVADALREGFNGEIRDVSEFRIEDAHRYDAHIAYGILRGCDKIFRACEERNIPWFNTDRGYFKPSHFDGYYRISHRGTQVQYVADITGGSCTPPVLSPMRTVGKYILICPPTIHVEQFFNPGKTFHSYPEDKINYWLARYEEIAGSYRNFPHILRMKEGFSPGALEPNASLDEHLSDAFAVVTFNSSIGWEAVRRGIPCLSSVEHSMVGSYYGEKSLDALLTKFYTMDREPLFRCMQGHQFTLSEIRAGKAWPLIKHYLSTSGLMDANRLPHTLRPIPFPSARNPLFQ